jgi:hypothetical protein
VIIYNFTSPTWWHIDPKFQHLEERAMEDALNYIDLRAKEIKDSLTHFMVNHSAIEPRKPYDEIWCPGPEGDRYYSDMDSVGMKMQSYLSECYGQFCSILDPLLNGQPEEVLAYMAKSKEVITRTIEHRITMCESSQQALQKALAAFEEQLEFIRSAYMEG